MTPASVIPVLGSRRPYADLNFAAGSFGLNGTSVNSLALLAGFTFTRASLAMGYDATGKLTYGPNNLCLQSQTFDNASWGGPNRTVTANTSVAPDGTTTADTVAGTGAGGTLLRQDVAVPSVATVVASFYVKANTATTCVISDVNIGPLGVFNLSTGAVISGVGATISSAGNGWYRCVVSYAPIGGFARVAINPGSTYNLTTTSAILVWGAQYEAVTYQTTPSTYYPTTTAAYYGPRLVYDPVTLASQGILVEEARTNLLLQSQTFDNASWTKTLATVTANAGVAPNGTTTADKVIVNNGSAGGRVQQIVTVSAATAYCMSAYVKADGWNWVALRIAEDGATSVYFDVSTGAVGNVESGWTNASIQTLGNGWFRVSATYTTVGTSYTWQITPTNGNAVFTTGNGTSGIFVWGAQLELGTGASSPIPTTTASVTRAADSVNFTGLSAAAPYSVVSEFNIPRTASGVDIVNWGTLANGAGQYVATTGLAFVRESSSTTALVSGSTITANITQKMAARYAVNDVNISVNGGIGTADTSVTPPTMSNLALANSVFGLGGINTNGTISRIRIYNRALSDAELQAITT